MRTVKSLSTVKKGHTKVAVTFLSTLLLILYSNGDVDLGAKCCARLTTHLGVRE